MKVTSDLFSRIRFHPFQAECPGLARKLNSNLRDRLPAPRPMHLHCLRLGRDFVGNKMAWERSYLSGCLILPLALWPPDWLLKKAFCAPNRLRLLTARREELRACG